MTPQVQPSFVWLKPLQALQVANTSEFVWILDPYYLTNLARALEHI